MNGNGVRRKHWWSVILDSKSYYGNSEDHGGSQPHVYESEILTATQWHREYLASQQMRR
jgi:hypothetical protein